MAFDAGESRIVPRVIATIVLSMLSIGCGTSKWAMDDPDYRDKYDRPYVQGEKYTRMAKQIVDARHVAKKTGVFVGVAGADEPFAVGGDIGLFYYPNSWLEPRISLSGLAGTGQPWAYGGVTTGLRIQTPTRLAPFAGAGLFAGVGSVPWVRADDDDIDNDDDLFIDEPGETKTDTIFMGAAYPEVGLHFWLTPSVRLTSSASYYFTTAGRSHDFWFIGSSLAFLIN